MKSIKIALSVILMTVIMTMLFCVGVSAEVQSPEETENFKKLVALGIVKEDDEILFESILTRGSFVKYIVKCAGSLYPASATEIPQNVFTDVNEQTFGYEEIFTALRMGVISEAPLFYPDRDITMPEAAKIAVTVLGYDGLAEHRGGYPNGYLQTAYDLKLFKDCAFEIDGTISTVCFFNIMMNLLESEVVTVDSFDESGMIHGSSSGETLLSKALDVRKICGVITSNAYASIYGDARVAEQEILIGDQNINVGETNAAQLLGYNVELYYREEAWEQKTVLYVKEDKNNTLDIVSSDIETGSVTSNSFRYYDEQKSKTETIAGLKSATFIYNGVQTSLKAEYLTKEHANIRLVDYDRDKKYDVIWIMDYRAVVVASVSQSSFKIADELGGESIEIKPDSRDYDVLITKDGKEISIGDIKTGDVISYAAFPGSSKYIKYLVVSSRKEEGFVQELSDDEMTVNSETYKMSSRIKSSVSPGEGGTFYIDFDGCVVWKKTEKDMVYGYLTKIGRDGISDIVVRIFTENNRWVTLKLQNKFRFIKAGKDLGNIEASDYYENHYEPQFIRYNVNKNGEVCEMHYAQILPNLSSPTDFDTDYAASKNSIDNGVFRQSGYFKTAKYREGVKSFDNTIGISDATKLFMIPVDKTDEEQFAVVRAFDLFGDSEYKNVYSYDADMAMQAKACVLEGNAINVVSGESKLIVVERVMNSTTEDGDETLTIIGSYIGSTGAILQLKDESVADGKTLTAGDILQVSFDGDGYIAKISEVYDIASGIQQYFCSTSNEYTTSTKMAGMVKYMDYKNYRIILDNGTSVGTYSTSKLSTVYIYDTQEKTVKIGSSEDIDGGSYVFAFVRQFSVREVVIIK